MEAPRNGEKSLITSYHILSHLITSYHIYHFLVGAFQMLQPWLIKRPYGRMISNRHDGDVVATKGKQQPYFWPVLQAEIFGTCFFCYTELYPIHFVHVIHLQSKHGLGKSPALSIAFFDPGNTWQYSSSIVRFPNCETTLVHLALAQVATLDQWLLMILLLLHDGWFLILVVDDCCQRFFGSWSLNIFDWWLDMIGVSRLSMW